MQCMKILYEEKANERIIDHVTAVYKLAMAIGKYALAVLRRSADYYPEVKKSQENFELTEYNCPILSISKNFGIACSLETQMFSQVLDANVKSTHRQVNGYSACRFLISRKSEENE